MLRGPPGGPGLVRRPSRWSGRYREALLVGQEGWKAYLKVQER